MYRSVLQYLIYLATLHNIPMYMHNLAAVLCVITCLHFHVIFNVILCLYITIQDCKMLLGEGNKLFKEMCFDVLELWLASF